MLHITVAQETSCFCKCWDILNFFKNVLYLTQNHRWKALLFEYLLVIRYGMVWKIRKLSIRVALPCNTWLLDPVKLFFTTRNNSGVACLTCTRRLASVFVFTDVLGWPSEYHSFWLHTNQYKWHVRFKYPQLLLLVCKTVQAMTGYSFWLHTNDMNRIQVSQK